MDDQTCQKRIGEDLCKGCNTKWPTFSKCNYLAIKTTQSSHRSLERMALHDNKDILLSHLRHVFVTNDDSGVSEMVMLQEDLDTELSIDKSFQKRGQLRLHSSRSNPEKKSLFAKSFDIHGASIATAAVGRREDRNVFDMNEIRMKVKSEKCKVIHWKEGNTLDKSLFEQKEIVPRDKSIPATSKLSTLLSEFYQQGANPYLEYSKFDGESHEAVSFTNTFKMFLSMTDDLTPIKVIILSDATVEQLVGLTFYKYLQKGKSTIEIKSVRDYCIRIAEDTGEVDTDFPPLDRHEQIGKFGFDYLGICEIEHSEQKLKVVNIHYEDGGCSKLAIHSMDISMNEIMTSALKKRRLLLTQSYYKLEKKGIQGMLPVDLSQSLNIQNTMDFYLVQRKPQTSRQSSGAQGLEESGFVEEPRLTSPDAEITLHQYKTYYLSMVNKMRKNKVKLGISREQIDIQPTEKGLFSVKAVSYEMDKICNCQLIEDKGEKLVIRITRLSKDENFKDMDFESDEMQKAREIVHKLEAILKTRSTRGRTKYLEKFPP